MNTLRYVAKSILAAFVIIFYLAPKWMIDDLKRKQ